MALTFTFIFLLTFLRPFSARAVSEEGRSLLSFKASVADPRGALAGWSADDASPCNWTGIWCDPALKNVISVNLAGRNLSGPLIPALGSLRKLHRLYLQYNHFNGEIPQELANCTRLRTLSLHHNDFSGNIPPQLARCVLLQALYLQSNALSGLIPASLGNLSSLMTLNLSYNKLDGVIPTNGVFMKFGADSYIGNLQLCGGWNFSSCGPVLSPSSSLNIDISAPVKAQGGSHGLSMVAIAGICVGAFVLFKGACMLFLLWRWSKYTGHKEINLGYGGKLVMFQGGASISSSRELLKCIGKLENKDVIGEGGYGVVYKLVHKDSNVFAVKKLKQCLESVRGFEAELETLGAVKHRNLVRLLGYCTSSTVKLLIYEYLPNGTLEQVLHCRAPDRKPLDWPTRHNIALGVARGLAYLHHDCNPTIIHRDITASNILLDSDLQPHLADFGLARVIGLYDTHVTATVAGTFGYIAPEYAEAGRASDKVDVYSFGVVLLELLTGRRPADSSDGNDISLAAWVRKAQESGEKVDAFDRHLRATAPDEELQTAMLVACACVSKKPENRPSMKRVVEYLEMEELHLNRTSALP